MIIFFSTIFLYPFFWIYNYIFGWREFSEDEIKHWAKRKLNQKIFNYEKKQSIMHIIVFFMFMEKDTSTKLGVN